MIKEINGSQVKGFLVNKGNRPVAIKDLLNDNGEISQSVLKEYMSMMEIVRLAEATRKLLVKAINKNIPQEKGDLLGEVVQYGRSNFDKEKALEILAGMGYTEAEFINETTCNKLEIK